MADRGRAWGGDPNERIDLPFEPTEGGSVPYSGDDSAAASGVVVLAATATSPATGLREAVAEAKVSADEENG